MHDQNQPDNGRPRRKESEPLKPVLILFILLLLGIAGAGIYYFNKHDAAKKALENEPLTSEEQLRPPGEGTAEVATGDSSAKPMAPDANPAGAELLPEGEQQAAAAESAEEKKARECKLLAEQIHGFFVHIDSEDYIGQFPLNEPSQAYFIALANKLLQNPPVVSRESDDLYTILKNMAHFFRVIGKDNIILIKTILDRERDKIEDVAAEIYQWTASGSCTDDQFQFAPSLSELYEYAGFFLNTMGGRSYLFRRDSRSRLLVNYYSILLIERANQEGTNRHGIDITQIIPQLIQEIDSSSQLIYKENYIDSLYTLLEKYQ